MQNEHKVAFKVNRMIKYEKLAKKLSLRHHLTKHEGTVIQF